MARCMLAVLDLATTVILCLRSISTAQSNGAARREWIHKVEKEPPGQIRPNELPLDLDRSLVAGIFPADCPVIMHF